MGYDVKVEDIEYLRHGTTPYLATIYRPQGTGPFPIMVELHDGVLSRVVPGHPLRDSLDQVARGRARRPSGHGGLDGQLERRAPGDAACDAAVRSALQRAAAGDGARARPHPALPDPDPAPPRSA